MSKLPYYELPKLEPEPVLRDHLPSAMAEPHRGRTNKARLALLATTFVLFFTASFLVITLLNYSASSDKCDEVMVKPHKFLNEAPLAGLAQNVRMFNVEVQPQPLQRLNSLEDIAGDAFAKCCRESGLVSACGEGWCTYPPLDPWTPWDIKCVGEHVKQFIQCYAQQKNNKECCARNDVVGAYAICQDLCDGTAENYTFNIAYVSLCKMRKDAISKCNHDSDAF
jgi:hypothetical protein